MFTQERALLVAQTGAETLLKLSEGTTPDAHNYFEALQQFLSYLASVVDVPTQQLAALVGLQVQCLQLQGLWAGFDCIEYALENPAKSAKERQSNICFFSPYHHAVFATKPIDDATAVPISASTQQVLMAFSTGWDVGLTYSQTCSAPVLQKAFRFLRFYLESFQGLKLYSYPLLEACLLADDG